MDLVDDRLLDLRVDRGGDLQAAGVDLVFVDAGFLKLADDRLLDQPVGALGLGSLPRLGRVLGLRVLRGVTLLLGDGAHAEHAVEHVVPAGFRALAVGPRVKHVRGLDGRGEHRTFLNGEVLDVLVEVGVRGGVDAVGVAPEVDGVEVGAKDLVLGPLAGHLGGDHQLLGLTGDAELIADHGVLHVLLRDGGATASAGVTGELAKRSAAEAGQGETGVVVEIPVLRGEDGLANVLRDLGDVHVGAVTLGRDDARELRLIVGGHDVGNLVVDQLLWLRDLGHGVGSEEGHDGHDDGDRDERGEAHQDFLAEFAIAPVVLLACPRDVVAAADRAP